MVSEKETVGVRLATDKVERIEQMAEEKDITKSDATRRLIDKGLDLEEAGITVAAADVNADSNPTYANHLGSGLFQSLLAAVLVVIFLAILGVI